jgi:hypothetical protein
VRVAVRPDEVKLGAGSVKGTVVGCEFAGGPWRCRIRVGEEEVAAYSATPLKAGETVSLAPPDSPRTPLSEER